MVYKRASFYFLQLYLQFLNYKLLHMLLDLMPQAGCHPGRPPRRSRRSMAQAGCHQRRQPRRCLVNPAVRHSRARPIQPYARALCMHRQPMCSRLRRLTRRFHSSHPRAAFRVQCASVRRPRLRRPHLRRPTAARCRLLQLCREGSERRRWI